MHKKSDPSLKMIDRTIKPPKQLLKWIGNKQKFAPIIINNMPEEFKVYFEPFIGSGAILGALSPKKGVAGDTLLPLIELWKLVQNDPEKVIRFYEKKWGKYIQNPRKTYSQVKDSYNKNPNPLDFLFISRSCYGGVLRFTKTGTISTPIGPHKPIPPKSFEERVNIWNKRIKNTKFYHSDFEKLMKRAKKKDLIYCDPPYLFSQSILYGAQSFELERLWKAIQRCKKNGTYVMLSIDGMKKSKTKVLDIKYPKDLFEREVIINTGKSMLRRFQKKGEKLKGEVVHDRLLFTW